MRPAESFDRTNVTELGLDLTEKQPELYFDPSKDITDADWKKMLTDLALLRKSNDVSMLLYTLGRLTEIDRDRVSLTPTDQLLIGQKLVQVRADNDVESLLGITSAMAKVDPRLFPLRDDEWSRILKHVPTMFSEKRFEELAEIALIDRSKLTLQPADREGLRNLISQEGDGAELATLGADIAAIDPSILDLHSSQWTAMLDALDRFRADSNSAARFTAQARDLTVIARALQTKSPATLQNIPSMPETKSYHS